MITATILERLLAEVPDLLDVDLLAGTSTGGIIALALADGLSPTVVRQLYEYEGKDIFHRTMWDAISDLATIRGATYGNDNLRYILRRLFGTTTTLGALDTHVVIPAFDLDNEHRDVTKRCWKPKVFHNFPGADSDADVLTWKVALYTSAAPTYFPSFEGFVDGGVFANNPSMVALAQTQDERAVPRPPPLESIRLLSIGTGTSLEYEEGPEHDWGYARWAKPLVSLIMDGTMGIADYQCKRLLKDRYRRLAPNFPPGERYALDDVDRVEEMIAFVDEIEADIEDAVAWLDSHW